VKYDKTLRSELYQMGLTDSQISKELGVTYNAVALWRWKNCLPANRSNTFVSVKMEDALPPDKCDQMREFLASLVTHADNVEGRVDVMGFMQTYRETGFINKEERACEN